MNTEMYQLHVELLVRPQELGLQARNQRLVREGRTVDSGAAYWQRLQDELSDAVANVAGVIVNVPRGTVRVPARTGVGQSDNVSA